MRRKGHSPEQIVHLLRESEVALATGSSVASACQKLGISEQTYYRWRKRYGTMGTDELKRPKALEGENRRLKRLVAEHALDIQILKEAVEGKY